MRIVAALAGLVLFGMWLWYQRDPNFGVDATHRRASKAWRGIDWEGLSVKTRDLR